MKRYGLSIFLGITMTVNAQVLDVPEVIQEQNLWCWAGASKCVLDYYGYPHRQCEIAEYARTVSTINFGLTPCCEDISKGCNSGNYILNAPGSIQDILIHFGNISNDGAFSLSISDIQYHINQRRPFICYWVWYDGTGHVVVGHGIQDNHVYYMDPWFGEGFKISTYENFINDGQHEWTQTNVLTVSPIVYYTVTFAGENIEIASQVVKEGNSVIRPDDPTHETQQIVWYREAEYITEWNFNDVVTADITLYAKWVAKDISVRFYSQGGSLVPSQIEKYGTKITKPEDPVRAGYVFEGWYREAACITAWDFDVDVVEEEMTLYAKWLTLTGTEDFFSKELKVYPNPFTGQLHVAGADGCTLQVITESGALVHTQTIMAPDEMLRLEHLLAGVYFFRMEKDGQAKMVKVVKE